MARYLPSLAPAASAVGMKAEKGLADTVAMLQTIRKGSGSTEEAASSLNNIFQKMESEETSKKFKKMGVDLAEAMKKGRKEGRNLIEVFEEAAQKATKGDLSKLPQLIQDMEFARGIRALMTYRGEWQKLSATLQNTSGGTILRDLVQVTQDAQANLDRLTNSWTRFTQAASRVADAGGISRGLGDTAKEFEEIATALERINKAYAEGGLSGAIKQAAGDAGERLAENRRAELAQNKTRERQRRDELEADNKRFREKLEKEGASPESIAATMALRERDVDRSRRRLDATRDAARAARKIEPPAVPPNSPAAASTAGIPSLIDQAYRNRPALPFPQKPTQGPRVVPLPPERPAELGGGAGRVVPVEVRSLPSGTDLPAIAAKNERRATPDQRLDASTHGPQGPISAKVESPVPVAVTGTLSAPEGKLSGQITLLPSPMFTARMDKLDASIGAMKGTVAALGSRPGAVSMPGAATTPGAQ